MRWIIFQKLVLYVLQYGVRIPILWDNESEVMENKVLRYCQYMILHVELTTHALLSHI